ncbi:hypothetical protein [Streptomyces sp. Rer75]|uniref:hypothetical protein n=1 Tax=Streptomyces sp. Rer75 TaxID=2750011 RepID=UPI0035A0770E
MLGLLRHAVDALGATVVMVTHDPVAASYADRVLLLTDGAIADRLTRAPAHEIADRMPVLVRDTAKGPGPCGPGPFGRSSSRQAAVR